MTRKLRRLAPFAILSLASAGSLLYIFSLISRPVRVVSTSPATGSTLESLSTPITIRFAQAIPDSVRSSLEIVIIPILPFRTSWDTPTILSLLPTQPFPTATTYHVQVSLEKTILSSFSFTTPKSPPLPDPQVLLEQGREDLQFSRYHEQLLDQYPFLAHLPIITAQYTIVYDFELKKIRVRLNTGVDRSQVETGITTQLTNIGVDLKKISLYYLY